MPNQSASAGTFQLIALGTQGGLIDGETSAYLLAPVKDTNFVALDAGSLVSGINRAAQQGSFKQITASKPSELSLTGQILQQHIKAYAISHAHLDHIAGLVIGSTDDSPKPIYAAPSTIETIQEHLFNWQVWPNFADAGPGYPLAKYHYQPMLDNTEFTLDGTAMHIKRFPLSHSSGYESSAFLVRHNQDYVLYLGDTGPDEIEKSDRLLAVWQYIAPLIKNNQLKGLMIESSYPNSQPDGKLFGHLTPFWVHKELKRLALVVNQEQPELALRGLNVLITHIKPSLSGDDMRELVTEQINQLNDLGVTIIVPESGQRILL